METVARVQEAEAFYINALQRLTECGVPFMVGGAYAMRQYADIHRDTKDLDVFCKAGDYPHLLEALHTAGYSTEITDANWLAKAFQEPYFIDLIFNAGNGLCTVDETWFQHAPTVILLGVEVKLIPAEEEIWTKLYIRDRQRYDGADICHIIRKQGRELDWERLLMRMETHWELLFGQLLEFQFVYPSERDAVPRWLMEELISRARAQLDMPRPKDRICRGNLLSRSGYEIDERAWGYRPK